LLFSLHAACSIRISANNAESAPALPCHPPRPPTGSPQGQEHLGRGVARQAGWRCVHGRDQVCV